MRGLVSTTVIVLVAGVSSCGRDSSSAPWTPVSAPVVESSTDPVEASLGTTLANGRYWGTLNDAAPLGFDVAIARFGETCDEWASAQGMTQGCPNDYLVQDAGGITVALADHARVTVAAPSGPGTSWEIDPTMLQALIRGETEDTPVGYAWTPFPFVITVDDGVVAVAEQHWLP